MPSLFLCLFLSLAVKDTDRLSVVTYDTNVKVDFGLTTMNQENKDRSKVTVKAIRDGSSTNLCGGLLKGMKIKQINDCHYVGLLPS